MALPTNGRILLDTTAGDIEIELWSKEAPKACRNLIQLALEGYYDGVIFHRVVPGFLVQTGDRTGTGGGGESIYGEQFEDEIHPRLRFPHRGLVALANNGEKDTNDSQFFITLDRAEELHGTHTLFGRTVGDSIFNVLKIASSELGENNRPLYPPKIKTIRILDNPFDDIVPRITAAEKQEQQRLRQQMQKEREEASRKKTKKNPKLLSFGQDEEEELAQVSTVKKKGITRPDLMDVPDAQPWVPPADVPPIANEKSSSKLAGVAPELSKLDESKAVKKPRPVKTEKSAEEKGVKSEIEKMEEEIRRLTKRRNNESDSDDENAKKKAKGPSLLSQELSKYAAGRGRHAKKTGKKRDETDIMAAMSSFRGKLKNMGPDLEVGQEPMDVDNVEVEKVTDEGLEVDDDVGWLSHRLHFPKDNTEEVDKAERDYEVIDPRARASRAKEEERQKKARQHGRSHRGR